MIRRVGRRDLTAYRANCWENGPWGYKKTPEYLASGVSPLGALDFLENDSEAKGVQARPFPLCK